MKSLGRIIHRILPLFVVAFAAAWPVFAADETFDTLSAGRETFTNVTVLNKTRSDVFISHSKGMCSVKVKDLDPATQLKLGYQLESPKTSKLEKVFKTPDLSKLQSDPKVQEVEMQLAAALGEFADRLDTKVIYGFVGGVVFFYLLFCLLCRSICMKAAVAPVRVIPLVWLPLLKQIPLLKAAGMSPWWILTNFVPGLFLLTYVIWSIKITQARGKHVLVGVMLILPVTNLLAFLYLALSRGGEDSNAGADNVISLQSTPRREAA